MPLSSSQSKGCIWLSPYSPFRAAPDICYASQDSQEQRRSMEKVLLSTTPVASKQFNSSWHFLMFVSIKHYYDMLLRSILSFNHHNTSTKREVKWPIHPRLLGFPLLALKIPCPWPPLVPGKPKWLISLKKGFILIGFLKREFDGVYCSFF